MVFNDGRENLENAGSYCNRNMSYFFAETSRHVKTAPGCPGAAPKPARPGLLTRERICYLARPSRKDPTFRLVYDCRGDNMTCKMISQKEECEYLFSTSKKQHSNVIPNPGPFFRSVNAFPPRNSLCKCIHSVGRA